jgi:hypothetical protein
MSEEEKELAKRTIAALDFERAREREKCADKAENYIRSCRGLDSKTMELLVKRLRDAILDSKEE